jgi:hypothetical protein
MINTVRCILLLTLAACALRGAQPVAEPKAMADVLSGRWMLRLHLDSADAAMPDPQTREVTGEVYLYRDTSRRHAPQGTFKWPTHSGEYAVDFTRFGFDPRREGMPRFVRAHPIGEDSVRIEFDPGLSHGYVDLIGRLDGDSIVGSWMHVIQARPARGTFVMLRRGT